MGLRIYVFFWAKVLLLEFLFSLSASYYRIYKGIGTDIE
jgi:hypothetical protein